MPMTTVVFDVGETLVDETRHWSLWAGWMGVPTFTFFAAMGAVIERGLHHREVFELLRPGFDPEAEIARRVAAGYRHSFEPGDFYPDALACMAALKAAGYRIGLAGNQPEVAEGALNAANLPVDFIASSARWGVEKPSPAFFARVAEAAGAPESDIAYVGDRLDNDVAPALAAGMTAVFIRRGPWGFIQPTSAGAPAIDGIVRIDSLAELPAALARQAA
jgi:FMN phosphatase YigB (HAD superfamily)